MPRVQRLGISMLYNFPSWAKQVTFLIMFLQLTLEALLIADKASPFVMSQNFGALVVSSLTVICFVVTSTTLLALLVVGCCTVESLTFFISSSVITTSGNILLDGLSSSFTGLSITCLSKSFTVTSITCLGFSCEYTNIVIMAFAINTYVSKRSGWFSIKHK